MKFTKKSKIFFNDLKRSGYNYQIFKLRRKARRNKTKEIEKLSIQLCLVVARMAAGKITFFDEIKHDIILIKLLSIKSKPLPCKHIRKGEAIFPIYNDDN
jgi:hypothetical protein